MRRFDWRIDLLAPLGLLLIVGSFVWTQMGRTLPGKPGLFPILGAALILTHLVLRWDDVLALVGRRQMKYGANTLVLSVVVLGVLGLVNYLVYRHSHRWDLTKSKRYSLSDQTRKVVAGLKDDVTIWYFQRAAEMQSGQDRLKEYQTLSPRLKMQFVDPVAKPMTAQAHEARGPWPTLIIERGDKREKVSNDSEQDITNAIIKVTRGSKKSVCFAAGEGERDMDDSGETGFSAAKSALVRSQYDTQKVFLAREPEVPANCTVLVVAGPDHDLLAPTTEAVRRFVRGGGKLLLMVEPETKQAFPNLDALAKDWNVELGKDIVLDVSPMGQLFGTGPLTPLALEYPYHEITKDFRVATAFHTARSATAGTGTVTGVVAQSLVQTAPQSWAESDLTLKEPVEMNAGKDKKGPIALGAVATVEVTTPPAPAPSASPAPVASASPASAGSPSPAASPSPESEPPAKRQGRVAVFGDSDFASNALLGFQGNQDFYLNTVAWLAEDADLISIRPKEPEDQRMFLTQQQQQTVMWLSLLFVPGLFLVWGVTNWWRRRA
jgi:gliding motility-associatede transport system auxiliary component